MSTNLFNQCFKQLTLSTIGTLMNGSLDPFTLEDELNNASQVRQIVGHVQILSFEGSLDQGCTLQLGFSPLYLAQAFYVFIGLNADFKWQLTLPIYKTSDPGDDDYDGVDEIGLIEWLTLADIKTDEPRIESIGWTLLDYFDADNEVNTVQFFDLKGFQGQPRKKSKTAMTPAERQKRYRQKQARLAQMKNNGS